MRTHVTRHPLEDEFSDTEQLETTQTTPNSSQISKNTTGIRNNTLNTSENIKNDFNHTQNNTEISSQTFKIDDVAQLFSHKEPNPNTSPSAALANSILLYDSQSELQPTDTKSIPATNQTLPNSLNPFNDDANNASTASKFNGLDSISKNNALDSGNEVQSQTEANEGQRDSQFVESSSIRKRSSSGFTGVLSGFSAAASFLSSSFSNKSSSVLVDERITSNVEKISVQAEQGNRLQGVNGSIESAAPLAPLKESQAMFLNKTVDVENKLDKKENEKIELKEEPLKSRSRSKGSNSDAELKERSLYPIVHKHDFNKEVALSNLWKNDLNEMKKQIIEISHSLALDSENDRDPVVKARLAMNLKRLSKFNISLHRSTHLLLVIHGIGQHKDFIDHDVSWEGKAGVLDGGLFDFKLMFDELFYKTSKSGTANNSAATNINTLRDLPISIHCESVEWHESLREEFEIEDFVRKNLMPEGNKKIRDFLTDTLLDGFMYLTTKFGKRILYTVAQGLNEKYHAFCESNPNFKGPVHVFAHSLGSLIILDLLTGNRFDVQVPKLDFQVSVLYLSGSPISYLRLVRGDFFDDAGKFSRKLMDKIRFLPKNTRVVNYIHPNDPISWKCAPLFATDNNFSLSAKEIGVPILAMDTMSIGDVLEVYRDLLCYNKGKDDQLSKDIKVKDKAITKKDDEVVKFKLDDNVENRVVDFVVNPPRSFYENILDTYYVITTHSTYWSDINIATSMIVVLMEPFYLMLESIKNLKSSKKYQNYAKTHLMTTERLNDKTHIIEKSDKIDLHQQYTLRDNIFVHSTTTGYSYPNVAILQNDKIYIYETSFEDQVGAAIGTVNLAEGSGLFSVEYVPEVRPSSGFHRADISKQILISPPAPEIPINVPSSDSGNVTIPKNETEKNVDIIEGIKQQNQENASSLRRDISPDKRISIPLEKRQSSGTESTASNVTPNSLTFTTPLLLRAFDYDTAESFYNCLLEVQKANKEAKIASVNETSNASSSSSKKGDFEFFGLNCFANLEQIIKGKVFAASSVKYWFTLNTKVKQLKYYREKPLVRKCKVIDVKSIEKVFVWPEAQMFRLIYNDGCSVCFRMQLDGKPEKDVPTESDLEMHEPNNQSFTSWLDYFTAFQKSSALLKKNTSWIDAELQIVKERRFVVGHDLLWFKERSNIMYLQTKYYWSQVTVYLVHIFNDDNKSQIVKRRHKEFETLHKEILNLKKDLGATNNIVFPEFPVSSASAGLDQWNARCTMFNGYIRELKKLEVVTRSQAWKDFCNIKETEMKPKLTTEDLATQSSSNLTITNSDVDIIA